MTGSSALQRHQPAVRVSTEARVRLTVCQNVAGYRLDRPLFNSMCLVLRSKPLASRDEDDCRGRSVHRFISIPDATTKNILKTTRHIRQTMLAPDHLRHGEKAPSVLSTHIQDAGPLALCRSESSAESESQSVQSQAIKELFVFLQT